MTLPRRLDLDGMLRYVGALPDPQVPDYRELSVRLGWRATRSLELSLSGIRP